MAAGDLTALRSRVAGRELAGDAGAGNTGAVLSCWRRRCGLVDDENRGQML